MERGSRLPASGCGAAAVTPHFHFWPGSGRAAAPLLWQTAGGGIGSFGAADFTAYIQHETDIYVVSARVVGMDSPGVLRGKQPVRKLPLTSAAEQSRERMLVVTWRLSTFDGAGALAPGLRISLFSSGRRRHPPLRGAADRGIYVAASPGGQASSSLRCVAGPAAPCCFGPSGTGKSPGAIYMHSSRAKGLHRRKLLASRSDRSRTFWHQALGAFTANCRESRRSWFERAKDGTLFLDEIGELPINLQAKAPPRAGSESISPVGDTEERQVRARIIAATNRNLEQMVQGGAFVTDLRFRLVAVRLELPAWCSVMWQRSSRISALRWRPTVFPRSPRGDRAIA